MAAPSATKETESSGVSSGIEVAFDNPLKIFAPAQALLGLKFILGLGVLQDYREAAKTSDADAQAMIGQMYFSGQGVLKDLNVAIKWFKRAA